MMESKKTPEETYRGGRVNLIEYIESVGFGEDYFSVPTDFIFLARDYFNAKKNGLPTVGMWAMQQSTGKVIGVILDNDPYVIRAV